MNSRIDTVAQLLSEREGINQILAPSIDRYVENAFLAHEIKRCTLPGRKVRSLLFLRIAENFTLSDDSKALAVFALELSHAASILVDDLVDQDDIRHGTQATAHSWGQDKAILFAHILTATALKHVSRHPRLSDSLTHAYERMAVSEVYDILIPPGDWILSGYTDICAQKTTALFGFAATASHLLSEETNPDRLRAYQLVGEDLGLLYQICNDYYDWQPQNIIARHDPTQSWRITFSLPLAVFLMRSGLDCDTADRLVRSQVLSFFQWKTFLKQIWTESVLEDCQSLISDTQERLIGRIEALDCTAETKEFLSSLAALIQTEAFWFHVYDMTPSQQ